MTLRTILTGIALCAFASIAYAHGDIAPERKAGPVSTEETAFGRRGDPRKLSRTIEVDMSDRM